MALKTPTSRRNPESGLTLIEMLIALALLGIVLLGIAPLFIASVQSNYSANEYTSIHNLARDRLEQLMNLPVTDPQLSRAGGVPAGSGSYPNDLPPTLPDPATGVPMSTGPNKTARNPLERTYQVHHFRSTPPLVPGNAYTLTEVGPGVIYDIKRIDVTVTSVASPGGTLSTLGIGNRTARVSGFIRNPDPAANVN
jgi:prepilin-type N-terminal cleavage/methylation domain-containing protein